MQVVCKCRPSFAAPVAHAGRPNVVVGSDSRICIRLAYTQTKNLVENLILKCKLYRLCSYIATCCTTMYASYYDTLAGSREDNRQKYVTTRFSSIIEITSSTASTTGKEIRVYQGNLAGSIWLHSILGADLLLADSVVASELARVADCRHMRCKQQSAALYIVL